MMKMMKQRLLCGLLIAIVGFVLAGCSNNATERDSEALAAIGTCYCLAGGGYPFGGSTFLNNDGFRAGW